LVPTASKREPAWSRNTAATPQPDVPIPYSPAFEDPSVDDDNLAPRVLPQKQPGLFGGQSSSFHKANLRHATSVLTQTRAAAPDVGRVSASIISQNPAAVQKQPFGVPRISPSIAPSRPPIIKPRDPPAPRISTPIASHHQPPACKPRPADGPRKAPLSGSLKAVAVMTASSAQNRAIHVVSPPLMTPPTPSEAIVQIGTKRRLGMGRTAGGYSNKKFKPPT
jgi:hypothetical protein